MDSKYPTLDLLERHGLRAAYMILILGCYAWTRLQRLHDNLIPEDCRLPRNMLLALKKERAHMLGVGRAAMTELTDDATLLDEFNRARGSNTLDRFYEHRFVDSLNLPKEEIPDDDEMIGAHWQHIAPTRNLHSLDGMAFCGTWRSLDVEVMVILASSEGHAMDDEYRSLEAAHGFQELYIHIAHRGPLTRSQMDAVASVPRHDSFLRVIWNKSGVTFYHELPSEGLGKHLVYQGLLSQSANLTDAGVAKLTEIVARIGVTNFRTE